MAASLAVRKEKPDSIGTPIRPQTTRGINRQLRKT
jgi:hypothetical protein